MTRSTATSPRRLLMIVALLLAVVAAGCGTSSGPTTTSDEPVTTSTSDTSSSSTALFDSSFVHEISLTFDQGEYDQLVDTYQSTGEKDWIVASVTIDGTTIDNVGIRLKGNSSLRGPRGGQSTTNWDNPETLPWLIRFDKFVDGQDYQKYTDLVIRSNSTETSLNEAVALELLDAAGLASQEAIATSFSVNGSESKLRLAVENPDDVWMAEHFSSADALYKAEATGDYSYRGTDPDSYDEVFDQEAGKDNADLTPLIEFLDFINNADDETFSSELPERLDVDSFATYLAVQELIDNFDDIDGPGNNSYLEYDTETRMFTVVPWDHNLAFGTVNGGGGGFPGGDTQTRGRGGAPGNGGPAGGPQASNVLSERFLTNAEFNALYQEKLAELKAQLYDSGVASDILQQWVDVLETSNLVSQSTIQSDADKIAAYFG
jgi:spore coat protein CotH